MAIVTIDLSSKNTAFGRLQGKSYAQAYNNVPNSALSKSLFENLSIVHKALAGAELQLADTTLVIKADCGVFQRMFTPVVGRQGESIVIKWGDQLIPLTADGGKLKGADSKLTLKAGKFNFSGRGEDTCLFASIKAGADTIRMPLAIRAANWETGIDADELAVMLDDDASQLVALLAELKTGGSGGGTRSDKPVLSLKDLPEKVSFSVYGARKVQTSYGVNHIMDVEGELDGVHCEFQVWGHASVRNVLLADPVLSKETPGELIVLLKKELGAGKVKVVASLVVGSFVEDDDSCSIDF